MAMPCVDISTMYVYLLPCLLSKRFWLSNYYFFDSKQTLFGKFQGSFLAFTLCNHCKCWPKVWRRSSECVWRDHGGIYDSAVCLQPCLFYWTTSKWRPRYGVVQRDIRRRKQCGNCFQSFKEQFGSMVQSTSCISAKRLLQPKPSTVSWQ